MAVVRKKQDDKFLKVLRELVTTGGGNRQCFDCGQKGPTYVNMTIGSFVCTRCSGVLRGITPPHRVKSISMATFTQEEIDFLKAHGNDLCAKTWLGLWDPKRAVHQDHRELMIDKYERKRYYLEPASPLKSLTNAASLKASSSSNSNNSSSASSTNTTLSNGYGNHHSSSSNSNHSSAISSANNNNNKLASSDSSFPNITLTPPTSQRTTQNGLHKSSSTAISRPQQNGFHQQQQQQQQQHHHDAFMTNNNGLSGLNVSIGSGSTSTGALSDTSSCTSNGFGPDADFVADFGSAYIFDATSAGGSVGSPAVSSASSVASSNGYAKIQPIKAAQFMNGSVNGVGGGGATSAAQLMMNGNGQAASARNHQNGTHNGNGTSTTENFADFDHAPIFNAIGYPMTNGVGSNTRATGSSSTTSANNNNNKLPAEDRYAALKDLDEQLRESKAAVAAAATVVGSTAVDSFGNNNNGIVNPFKSQQQQQNGAIVNPFQAAQQQQQNLFGQMSTLPNGLMTNGFGGVMQQQQQQQQQLQQPHQTAVSAQQTPPQQTAFFNFSNGFTTGATAAMFPAPVSSGPNGCGFGFGSMQQQIAATAGGGPFNNPFAATGALNSNNPFL